MGKVPALFNKFRDYNVTSEFLQIGLESSSVPSDCFAFMGVHMVDDDIGIFCVLITVPTAICGVASRRAYEFYLCVCLLPLN